MNSINDNLNFYYNVITLLPNIYTKFINIYTYYLNDMILLSSIVNYLPINSFNYKYSILILDGIYSNIINNNFGYFTINNYNNVNTNLIYYIYIFFLKILNINLFLLIIYTVFFITNLENYIKQIKTIISLAKIFILNATEKEVGPVDDYFFFAILFFLTITLLIFTSIIFIFTQSNIFIWALGGFFLLMLVILTIPTSLFVDFGINFCVGVRGSGTSGNLIKELMLDILSSSIVFIRFVVQNIRFLFIFFGIIELLEWVFSYTNSFIILPIYSNNNIFVNYNLLNNIYSISNVNFLIINTILFIILYLYYFLHLLFLLLVQVTIYIGVSIWLFFFLYSSKFKNKPSKFFFLNKIK